MAPYLSAAFLARVKAAYARAMAAAAPTSGQWIALDARRADVHAALLADGDDALRAIFADPTITDLYYGVDRLSRSGVRLSDPSQFILEALNLGDPRVRYAAYQIERLQEVNPDAQTVVEIGPGMGRAAYYGHLAGLDYTTIDLPLGIVAQACFLGAALGPDALWFAGEDDLPPNGRIKLLHTAPDRRFDVALNVDSLTEMSSAVAFAYFRWAAAHLGCLLSINHDKNRFTVAELAFFAAPHQLAMRRPCPVWEGYLEEVFLFRGPGALPRWFCLGGFETLVLARDGWRAIMRHITPRRRSTLM